MKRRRNVVRLSISMRREPSLVAIRINVPRKHVAVVGVGRQRRHLLVREICKLPGFVVHKNERRRPSCASQHLNSIGEARS
jgi:hypothetical protein